MKGKKEKEDYRMKEIKKRKNNEKKRKIGIMVSYK